MKDYTKPAFDLSKDICRKCLLMLFGGIVFGVFSVVCFLEWSFRVNVNPSVRSWTGENP